MRNNQIIRFLFVLYIITIILEKISWTFGGWGCNLFTIFTPILSVLLIIIYCVKRKPLRLDSADRRFNRYYLLLLLYVLLQFVVIDHTTNMTTQYIKGVVVLIIEVIAFFNFVMLINYDEASIDYEFVSRVFYIITIANVLYCVLQNINPQIDEQFVRFFHSTVVRYGTDSYGAMRRPTGFFIESNFNGPFLVIGFINEIYRLRTSTRFGTFKRGLQIVLIALTAFEIFMTLSLTTYIGFAVYGIIAFLNSNIQNKGRWILLFGTFALAVAYFYFTNSSLQIAVNSKFNTFSSIDTLKNNSHYVLAVQAISIFFLNGRNIIFGTGYNCLNVFFQNEFGYQVMKAHNYFLQRLCELGLLGFLLIIYYISSLYKAARSDTKEGVLLKTILITMLSMNFTYDAFTRNYNFIIVIMALLIYKGRVFAKSEMLY